MSARNVWSRLPISTTLSRRILPSKHNQQSTGKVWQAIPSSRPRLAASFSSKSAPALFWHRAGGFRDAPAAREQESPFKGDIWDFSRVQGTVKRLLDPEAATEANGRGHFAIIDVREVPEFVEGHIPGAINVPLSLLKSLDSDYPTLPSEGFRSQLIPSLHPDQQADAEGWFFGQTEPGAEGYLDQVDAVVYCRAGVRSAIGAEIINRRLGEGHPRVVAGDYKGSWNDWVEKGGEVEKNWGRW